MAAKILSTTRNRKLTIVVVALLFAMLLAPRDPAVITGPAGVYVLPAMISGICFGMAIMLLIDLVRGFGDESKAKEQEGA